MQKTSTNKTITIQTLNDKFRQELIGNGRIMITQGVQSLGEEAATIILTKVAKFDEFTSENDPYNEHDFGTFEYQENKIFWKIDYYDNDLQAGSQDPANPEITKRVLTIMLAEEY